DALPGFVVTAGILSQSLRDGVPLGACMEPGCGEVTCICRCSVQPALLEKLEYSLPLDSTADPTILVVGVRRCALHQSATAGSATQVVGPHGIFPIDPELLGIAGLGAEQTQYEIGLALPDAVRLLEQAYQIARGAEVTQQLDPNLAKS